MVCVAECNGVYSVFLFLLCSKSMCACFPCSMDMCALSPLCFRGKLRMDIYMVESKSSSALAEMLLLCILFNVTVFSRMRSKILEIFTPVDISWCFVCPLVALMRVCTWAGMDCKTIWSISDHVWIHASVEEIRHKENLTFSRERCTWLSHTALTFKYSRYSTCTEFQWFLVVNNKENWIFHVVLTFGPHCMIELTSSVFVFLFFPL